MELKFRVFANGKMRYDVTGFEHGKANEMAVVFLDGDAHTIGPKCIVMKATGKQDVNGKDVYPGDLYRENDPETGEEHCYAVTWMKSLYRYACLSQVEWIDEDQLVNKQWDNFDLATLGLEDFDARVVIGNIYENPYKFFDREIFDNLVNN